MKYSLRKLWISWTAVLVFSVPVQAYAAAVESNRFYLEWNGADFGNSAQAHGYLTLDFALLPAAGNYVFLSPGSEILDFSMTISGAAIGNASFTLDDFSYFSWYEPVPLDFAQDLVGQETGNGGWGSTFDGATGDFNLIAIEGSGAPSLGGAFQVATAEGLGDSLRLTAFRPAPVPVPAAIWMFAGGLISLLTINNKRRV
ncbi:hypothetical protein [Methylomonas sp. MgM2]